MDKIKIGIIGEDPNDTISVKNILSKKYENINFIPLLKNITGGQLDSLNKVNRMLEIEYKTEKCKYLIVVRDLDAFENDIDKLKIKNDWFNKIIIENKLFLLCIYEIEALILADIETFNKIYNTKITYNKNPMFEKDPKEFLKEKSKRKYSESDNPEIFKKVNIVNLINNCKFFKRFTESFEKISEI